MNRFPRSDWQRYILLIIAAGLIFLAFGGYLNPVVSVILDPVTSVQKWITERYNYVSDLLNASDDLESLQFRNQQLEQQVSSLQSEIIRLQQEVTEVEIMSALLDFARVQPENKYLGASIIAVDPNPFMQYVIINRGSDDGVRPGMPIVSDQGLVGRISQVSSDAARVQLITDPDSLINVKIQPLDEDAILTGSITSELSLDLINLDAEIQPGNIVLTSGLGGTYPANICIGQISSVRKHATDLFQTAAIQPFVDFERVEIVLIIINFQPYEIEPLLDTE